MNSVGQKLSEALSEIQKISESLLLDKALWEKLTAQKANIERALAKFGTAPDLSTGSDNSPIAITFDTIQSLQGLETKAAIKKLLEQCAELAGDDQSLFDFALAQPFMKTVAGPPKLFEPKRSKTQELGDNPGDRVRAAYEPPEGTLMRLDHLARINYSLYKQYNTWAGRNGVSKVERIITKSDYLALVARRLNNLGYSDELLASVGVSLEKQKKRPKVKPANPKNTNS